MEAMTAEEKIAELEKLKELDPNCRMCQEIFYPYYRNNWKDDGLHMLSPFAPRHKAMDSCRSGKYAHCTCDTCF